ncbi:DUF3551 domain-containing protein [Bradyrhizobium sp. LHD-71]|uniref:DUF3551 domain-containing protein n=1 Tax=Bradyrhizobium sp. LHD-71 TaxID=3072141 RepID=UPI00280F5558|nr:DUF3551 domain-containing protein [Bradyrhizobium sp. LHD-71]MDQ8726939.1 DUF3551 domain-containing protein [Bradyrhizobium sp. LHD-71]
MRKSIVTLSLLGAVLGLASVSAEAAPRGPARFYDQHGGFRGYAWCLQQGLEIFDCNYFNKAQCDMSASTRRVWCVQNPFAVVQGFQGGYGQTIAPIARKKVRRQVY